MNATRGRGGDVAPLQGVPLFVLMSLAEGAKHGHALTKDIERFAGVRLGPGTLYKAIGRLESFGLVAPCPPDARRRPYALTTEGRALLAYSIDYLGRVVAEGKNRLDHPVTWVGQAAVEGVAAHGQGVTTRVAFA